MASVRGAIEWVGTQAVMGFEWLETGVTFNPTDPRNRADPYPMYRRVRERSPLHRSRPVGGWVFTRYRDVFAVLRDERFSSDERGTPGWAALAGSARIFASNKERSELASQTMSFTLSGPAIRV